MVASIGAIGGVTAAFAADMPLKAQAPLAPITSWSGWYAGLNAAGIWSNGGDANHSAVAGVCDAGAVGCNPAVPTLTSARCLRAGRPSMQDWRMKPASSVVNSLQLAVQQQRRAWFRGGHRLDRTERSGHFCQH
jgi:hypothetical protein